jgi:hypothetical protein
VSLLFANTDRILLIQNRKTNILEKFVSSILRNNSKPAATENKNSKQVFICGLFFFSFGSHLETTKLGKMFLVKLELFNFF